MLTDAEKQLLEERIRKLLIEEKETIYTFDITGPHPGPHMINLDSIDNFNIDDIIEKIIDGNCRIVEHEEIVGEASIFDFNTARQVMQDTVNKYDNTIIISANDIIVEVSFYDRWIVYYLIRF